VGTSSHVPPCESGSMSARSFICLGPVKRPLGRVGENVAGVYQRAEPCRTIASVLARDAL